MDPISHLREALIGVLKNQESQYDEQELFDKLMVQKTRILHLVDDGPPNPKEKQELESGKVVIDGKQVAVNSDFARLAIFLSQQLGCSERYVASVLHTVMVENPNVTPVDAMELTVELCHERRRHAVDCLHYILEITELSYLPQASHTYQRIAEFFKREIFPHAVPPHTQGTQVALSFRIFRFIVYVDKLMDKVDASRKSAGSNSIAPSAQGQPPALGYDILNALYESMKYERRELALSLYFISRLGYLIPPDIKTFIDWLSGNPNHPLTYYFLACILVTFDVVDPETIGGQRRDRLGRHDMVLNYMTEKLSSLTEWKDPGLKATILLKYAMFLTELRHNDSSLETIPSFKTEELETQVWNAVQGGAFTYLTVAVAQLQRKRDSSPASSLVSLPPSDQQEQKDAIPEDFKQTVLTAFEALVRSLITHASSELRKIKQRQEDLVLASARDRTRTSSRFAASLVPEPDRPAPTPRNDIAMLYTFIGLLYNALPAERALQFWGSGPLGDSQRLSYLEYLETTTGRLPSFLQWAVWSTPVQDATMMAALYDMLSGLAKGQQCSELAYNFMARGGGDVLPGGMISSSSAGAPISWTAIFGQLEIWAASALNPRSPPQAQSLGFSQTFGGSLHQFAPPQPEPAAQQPTIGPKDVLVAQSFLRLLSSVVTYSVAVRTTISGHAQFRAIPTLVSLIPLGIPLELKGALFQTIAAFCEPGAGAAGVEICKAVWTLMERSEVINVRVGSTGGFGPALVTGKGVELELEQIEAVHRLYPATIPFLRLLDTLLHTPKRVPARDRMIDAETIDTIPESLGQPYRLPGIAPFTSFVIDNVFANIPNREYSRPSDRWEMNDLCLCFIERALASFNLESLVSSPEDTPLKIESLISLLIHPGYDIMKRMLTSSPLQERILTYIVEGVTGFEKNNIADEEPFFRNTIVRVLRIVYRVLEIQDVFLDVLIPMLSDFDSAPFVGTVYPRSYFTRFDQALSFGPQFIPALAAYTAYPTHSELVLLSVKIIASLSTSISSSTLTSLIERSDESERILTGFMQILNVESMDDVSQAEEFAEQMTGAGAPDIDDLSESLEQGIRLAALDLLIQDTEMSRPYPNIAHFLLFGRTNNLQQIQDPNALGARETSIHVLLHLINSGVPRLKGKRKEREQHTIAPLFIGLPALAERCYHIIYQLCVNQRTSEFTTRYLRTREDFFARQLASVPSKAPQAFQDPCIQAVYADGSRITTTMPFLSSFIRLRSYIFDLVALELHFLTNKGHHKGAAELLVILFGNDVEYEEEEDFPTFHELGQTHMRIIDFLESLMFDWSDSLTVNPVKIQFLAQLNIHNCVRKDATGCEVVDRTALLQLLSAGKRMLHAQGTIVTAAQAEQLSLETKYVLESCAIENHRRKIACALVGGFESWRRLLDITLTKCFDLLPHDRRENMLFDLLHVLPAALQSTNVEEATAVLLSETILSTITKLREDRRHQIILQSVGGELESGSLPAERLYAILRKILDCILDNSHVELVRGNLYAALINFVHLISSSREEESPLNSLGNNLALSLVSSTMKDISLSDNQSIASFNSGGLQGQTSSLELGSLAVMKTVIERLIITISRDAIDGTEVWKTVAFMLLDALVQLSGREKQHVILSVFNRHGILSNVVRGIKESDAHLQSVLKPDPDDLNPVYVYESKLSLFIRMSQTRVGAERLLEAQLIPTLAQCDYLDSRPEADQSFMDQDSFLPSAIQRYHQLFMPALQVVDGILAVLGNKHVTATNQALDFLSSHGSTIVILLKTETDVAILALLEEMHLIITLCANLLPSVPKSELLSANSGFGAIHAAILGLSTKCLGRGQCFAKVVPQTDLELRDSESYAFGFGVDTKFDMNARRKDRLLCQSIVAYIGAASEFTEPEIVLVLSPITTIPRHEEGTYISATVPTVGDALGALDCLYDNLTETLKQIADISAELANRDHIGVENIREVLRDFHASLLQDLDVDQKRSLVCQELERIKRDTRREAKVLLDTMEMVLLLIWRHLEYYAEPRHMHAPPAKATLTNAMRLLATTEPEAFREDVGLKLAPILQRLSSIDLDDESLGRDWQANKAYVEIMCRRLRDSAGLHDEGTMAEGE